MLMAKKITSLTYYPCREIQSVHFIHLITYTLYLASVLGFKNDISDAEILAVYLIKVANQTAIPSSLCKALLWTKAAAQCV